MTPPSTGKIFFPPWCFLTTWAVTPPLPTTPFKLLFGEKPQLPSFPNPDIQHLHYGEPTSAEHYQLLQKICFLAKTFLVIKVIKSKTILTKTLCPAVFKSTTYCGMKISHLWGKTQNWLLNGKVLQKSQKSMTLMPVCCFLTEKQKF